MNTQNLQTKQHLQTQQDIPINQHVTTHQNFKVNQRFEVAIQHYVPPHSVTIAILLPAIGLTIDKYQALIRHLNAHGIGIVTADYPGYGANLPKVSRHLSYNYADLIQQFIPALVNAARQYPQFRQTLLIGHSLVAHLSTLYAQQHECAVAGIATGNIYYKHWQGKARLQMLFTALSFRILVNALGYLPGDKIGFGKREAKGLMHDFATTVLRGNYRHIIGDYHKSHAANLFLQVKGDRWAPMRSIQALADLYTQPQVEQIELPQHIQCNPHSVWLKAPEIASAKIAGFILGQYGIREHAAE